MKAIICREMGPPEKLVYDEMPPPPMGPKDVRIKVKAAGVNFPDSLIIQGKYQ
ncbi:MAG: NADPH:quinone oxidoreductase family protein, partial [Nevskia sp.]|nr:NADPH:quinone oxidoreductase family protein [Nevskia sp.]